MSTEYLDPSIYVENSRATFELDGSKMAYASNLRLLDVGCKSDGAHDYNRLLGAISLIKNIRLMDGRTELSALRNPAQYLAFKAQLRTNSDNKSTSSWLKQSVIGFDLDSINRKLNHIYKPAGTTADIDTTGLAYIDLRECFPILAAMPILPTEVFPNLKVEIEYHKNSQQTQVTTNGSAATIAATVTKRPVLAVDVVEDERLLMPLMKAMMETGVRWQEIETDRFPIPAPPGGTAAGDKQKIVKQSMGFIGKRVERLLLCKELQDGSAYYNTGGASPELMGLGNRGSSAFLREKTQYRLNGKAVYPGFEGVKGVMERLAIVSDEYGACQAYNGSNLYKWSNADVLMRQGPATGTDQHLSGKAYSGSLSYDCVRIGARVSDLQISIERENDNDPGAPGAAAPASTNLACNVNVFAEVDKALAITKDGYRIVYM